MRSPLSAWQLFRHSPTGRWHDAVRIQSIELSPSLCVSAGTRSRGHHSPLLSQGLSLNLQGCQESGLTLSPTLISSATWDHTWLCIWALGTWTHILEEWIASILTHWAISPAPCSPFPLLWLRPTQFLPNACHSCELLKFILLSHHSLLSCCPTTERFPVNEAAIKVSLPIFFCYRIIFPECIPQRGITSPPPPHPNARDWATHWPSNP